MRIKHKFDYEVDLYPSIINSFKDRYIFFEVPFRKKNVDIVITKSSLKILYSIEVKLSDWRRALKQAALNQIFTQFSYVALPELKVSNLSEVDLSKFNELGVGLISISQKSQIRIPAVRSKYFSLNQYRHVKQFLESQRRKIHPKTIEKIPHGITRRQKAMEFLQTRTY